MNLIIEISKTDAINKQYYEGVKIVYGGENFIIKKWLLEFWSDNIKWVEIELEKL